MTQSRINVDPSLLDREETISADVLSPFSANQTFDEMVEQLLKPEEPMAIASVPFLQTDFVGSDNYSSMIYKQTLRELEDTKDDNIKHLVEIIKAKIFDELLKLYTPSHQPGAFVENLEENQQILKAFVHHVFFAVPQRFSTSNYEVFSLIKSHKKITFTLLTKHFVEVGIAKKDYQFMMDEEGNQLYGFLKAILRSFREFADQISFKFAVGSKIIVKDEDKLVAWIIAYNHKRYQDYISRLNQSIYPTSHNQTHASSTLMITQSLSENNNLQLSEVGYMPSTTEELSSANMPPRDNTISSTKRHYIETDAQEKTSAKKAKHQGSSPTFR